MTSKPPPTFSAEELSRLGRDGLIKKIRFLEKELYRVHSVASTQGVSIPPDPLEDEKDDRNLGSSPRPPTYLSSTDTPANSKVNILTKENEMSKKEVNEPKRRKLKPFNMRLVALKVAYLGKNYGGFEFQASGNIESVEEVLWKALVKSCLIEPEDKDRLDWLPFQYAKCGRTDKGVSAFGQVISIKLRSSRPIESDEEASYAKSDRKMQAKEQSGGKNQSKTEISEQDQANITEPKPKWDPVKDELDYPRILNRLLPADVRVLAWCPSIPGDFDARFSCGERIYRYFFTQPAFAPLPAVLDSEDLPVNTRPTKRQKCSSSPRAQSKEEPRKKFREGWLNIEAMCMAAKYFTGSHDFRNFCRIDGARQITEYTRELFEVSIEEVKEAGTILPYVATPAFAPEALDPSDKKGPYPKVYSFNVYGNAFLWHQIRCMIGVLFLVGQGLEKPEIVRDLLDVKKYPRKPQYTMADEVPLVLWDCRYPARGEKRGDALDWIYNCETDITADHGAHGVYDHLWRVWHERKMDELLANRLLNMYSCHGSPSSVKHKISGYNDPHVQRGRKNLARNYRLYEGGDHARTDGKYIPVNCKQLQPSFEEINDSFARKKGFKSAQDMRNGAKGGNWLAELRARKEVVRRQELEEVGIAAARAVAGEAGIMRKMDIQGHRPRTIEMAEAALLGEVAAAATSDYVEVIGGRKRDHVDAHQVADSMEAEEVRYTRSQGDL